MFVDEIKKNAQEQDVEIVLGGGKSGSGSDDEETKSRNEVAEDRQDVEDININVMSRGDDSSDINFEDLDAESTDRIEENLSEEIQMQTPRRSERNRKPPKRFESVLKVEDITEPRTVTEALAGSDREKWKAAMKEEMDSLRQHKTWELVDLPEGRKALGCKWLFKIKQSVDKGIGYKARLMAQGFNQKYGVDYDVARQTIIRALLTLAGNRQMDVRQYDAKTAFLNGDLKETVYMKQPEGCIASIEEMKVCKLIKSLYGLKQAPKAWNDKLKEALNRYGFVQSNVDPCLFTKKENMDTVYLIVYVDDILMTSKVHALLDKAEQALSKSFEITYLGKVRSYLGLHMQRDLEGYFYVHQKSYIDKILNRAGLSDAKPSNIPMDPGYNKAERGEPLADNVQYQKLIGELLYVAVVSRPDIMAAVCILSQHTVTPTQQDWIEAKRVLRYLKGTKMLQLKLGPVENSSSSRLLGYADADWAQCRNDRKSNSGYIFQLHGATISWCTRKQSSVALSTAEAEYIALAVSCQEMLRKLLIDLEENQQGPSEMFEDNQSCLKNVMNQKCSNRTKHVDTKYYFIRDLVDQNIAEFKYCPTEFMLAD